MIAIGIDPGKSGAMSIIYEDGSTKSIPFDRGEYRSWLTWLADGGHDLFCVLERVSAMPGQGTVSMFTFGESYGLVQGYLEAFGIPYQLVLPRVWKREFGITSDKNTSVQVAKRMFPNAKLLRTERSRKDDDNIAESLLMAEYARRIHG